MKRSERRELLTYLAWRDSLPNVRHHDPEAAWEIFREAHGGKCAMCRKGGRDLVRDHCHETGWIRGLLCRSCNMRSLGPVVHTYVGYSPAHAADLRRMYRSTDPWSDPIDQRWAALWHASADGIVERECERRSRAAISAVRDLDWFEVEPD